MKTYKAPDGSLHCIDPEFEHLLPAGSVEIREEEAAALRRPTIEQLKADLLVAINAERDRREESGFPYRNQLLDSTPRSVQRITAAALAAQAAQTAGQPFNIEWACADNSTLTLDAAGVIGMPVALAQHASALHAHARTLKMRVEAAGSEAELDTIDIHAGWPGGEA